MRLTRSLGINPFIKDEIYRKIVLNKDINLDILKIKKDFFIPEIEKISEKEFVDFLENSLLEEEAKKLIKEYKLPIDWLSLVHKYIIDSDFFYDTDPRGLKFVIDINSEEKKYYLQIFPETTIENIKDVWFLIKKNFGENKQIKSRRKPQKKFNRNEEIYRLYSEGKTIAEIATIISKKYKIKGGIDLGLIKVVISNSKKLRKGKK
jgi:hypothetical protein